MVIRKILIVLGTRPEAIKLAPLIKELKSRQRFDTKVLVTGQHREMVDPILEAFEIVPDMDLNIFKSGQSITEITSKSLEGIENAIKEYEPDLLIVQGDTTAVFAGALAGFYNKVKVAHVEAGLRSGDIYSPYPEEANRMMTGVLSEIHFAPTEDAKNNLLRENIDAGKIYVTGNTGIDALLASRKNNFHFSDDRLNHIDFENKKVIILTAHRRENIGQYMENIFDSIKDISKKYEDVLLIYPMHRNPKVREIAEKILGGLENVILTEPIDYLGFSNLMAKSYLIVTDSGGIQEEAPSLGVPVLVVRKETERPEGIKAGTAKLIGVDRNEIFTSIDELISNEQIYDKMANAVNPYGDGKSAKRISDILEELSKDE